MSAIAIVDTSIFLNVLDVPGRNQDRIVVTDNFKRFIEENMSFLLPFASIVETGNHIAHLSNGHDRLKYAQTFSAQVIKALRGEAPWKIMAIPNHDDLIAWLSDFPNASMREISFGDHSIIKEFHELCVRHPMTHIFIWSVDTDLSNYNRLL